MELIKDVITWVYWVALLVIYIVITLHATGALTYKEWVKAYWVFVPIWLLCLVVAFL